MTPDRRLELLAYASACFKNGTSPFEPMHLAKKNVSADECTDLSDDIGGIIEDTVIAYAEARQVSNIFRSAEKQYQETQETAQPF